MARDRKGRAMPFVRPVLLISTIVLLLAASASLLCALGPRQLNAHGVKLMEQRKYREALEPLLEAHGALPYDETVRRNLAECYLGLGFLHLEDRRFAEAAQAFAEGRGYADDDPRFWIYRGYALLRQGEHGAAEVELNEALAMDEENPRVHRLLGQVRYESGRLYEATRDWRRARELDPDDTELAALLEKTARELEVETRMDRDHGRNFSISYDGQAHGGVGAEVLEVLEDAYREIGYNLNSYPETRVPVLLYATRDFSELTGSPDWSGGLYDGKIRIPVGGLSGMNARLRGVLYHEYSHVVARFLTRGRCPVWLNEGLAEVAEREHHDPPLEALAAAAAEGRLLSWERLAGPFDGLSPEEVRLAYEQSYSMVRYMLEQYQWYKLNDLLAALGDGRSIAEAVSLALGEYGVTYASLQDAWRRQLEEVP